MPILLGDGSVEVFLEDGLLFVVWTLVLHFVSALLFNFLDEAPAWLDWIQLVDRPDYWLGCLDFKIRS